MPGWFGGSWAYHGDDGMLFVDSGHFGIIPSADFGNQFRAGQTVGAYVNFETREGFFTLDGEKLDMGKFTMPLYH